MDRALNKAFGQCITRIISGTNLSKEESYWAFCRVLNNEVTDMQQGAFLAALTAKGESADEVAGGWQAIYELDTEKVSVSGVAPVVDNCGTGMDTFKTFNISTASSIVAAAGGVKVARHGARAITSSCGTVDIAEALGVDVECDVSLVAKSIEQSGLGLFNGMSPKVHPMALGRILSQISFGSPLNIAASLANPALPKMAVRGVYSKALLVPVAEVMRLIGYTHATVVYGTIAGSSKGMDEALVCGITYGARLHDGQIEEFSFSPAECGVELHNPELLGADKDIHQAAVNMASLLSGKGDHARQDAILLNAGLLFELTGKAATLKDGVAMARGYLEDGKAMEKVQDWVAAQNSDPSQGLAKLNTLLEQV